MLAFVLLRSFALFKLLMSWGHFSFGITLAKHCNLVFCSFVLWIDWLKPFLTDRAMTCCVNGLNSFMCWWCNTTIAAIGRKVPFHHTLPFMTKQRCSSVAATSRQHQTFGIIDTSVANSDILTFRADERRVREVHCTRGRQVRGPGKVKVHMISFSVIKLKIISVSQLPV